MKIIKIAQEDREEKKKAVIDYYVDYEKHCENLSPLAKYDLLKKLEEFKDDDWEISILYDDLKERIDRLGKPEICVWDYSSGIFSLCVQSFSLNLTLCKLNSTLKIKM